MICEALETFVRTSVPMMSSRFGSSEMRKFVIEVVAAVDECESRARRLRPLGLKASEWMSPAISLDRSVV